MKSIKNSIHSILLVSWILLIFGSLSATQPFWSDAPSTQTIERADSLTGFDITKYILHLNINEQTHHLSGMVEAQVTAEANLTSIDYELMGGSLSPTLVYVNTVETQFTFQNGIIHIPLNVSAGQQFITQVYYSGTPGNSPAPYNIGILFTTNAVYTLSNPDAGRYWWPSYDHPWDKALIDTNITVRGDWLASGNGLRTGITNNVDGTRTHHWVSNYPVATYVVGIAAGPYVEYNQTAGTLPIQNFVLPGQINNATIDFSNVPEMISYFSTVFGAYPFEKYGHSIVNMTTYAAMEHQTQTTIGAAYITGNHAFEDIVAHELAHQWMGNSVTPLTMREVWLKESFATYSEFLWTSHYLGWQSACAYMAADIQGYYISWENSNGAHTIFNPVYNEMFAPPTYQKSASVLHMLRLKMGNAAFFNFVQSLYQTYQGSNVITSEFVALAEQSSGQDLDQFFEQWIFSPGIPNASLTVFKDNIGTAKVVARTTSPTLTTFVLEIPLHLPNSTLVDSVVVTATPFGAINTFAYDPATDNLSNLQIDPNHWVLVRQYSTNTLPLISCLAASNRVSLVWEALACPLTINGYRIYRKQLPNGNWTLLNAALVQQFSYTDETVTNGFTYQYYITAVEAGGFESLPSNIQSATPIDFPFDWGFLVVDETRDGTGANISPNDQQVDDFYSYVLQNLPFVQWDYATQGAPSLNLLSHYALVLWHCDDFSEFYLDDNLNNLSSYVISGGKLVVSGWKYPSAMPYSFFQQFFPGVVPNLHNTAVFTSAQSTDYPDLYPDPAKLPANWAGRLTMCYTFPNAPNALAWAEIAAGNPGNGNPVCVRSDSNGTLILLGFPLYFMMQDEVKAFLEQLLPELYPDVANADDQISPPTLTLSCYPNPFCSEIMFSVSNSAKTASTIYIYNVKGQLIRSLINRDSAIFRWDCCDDQQRKVCSGVYLIRWTDGRQQINAKIIKLQ